MYDLEEVRGWDVVIYGIDYLGIHTFCIFSMRLPLLGMETVKLKWEIEPWEPPCLFTFCEIAIFLIFENILTKGIGRRVDISHKCEYVFNLLELLEIFL